MSREIKQNKKMKKLSSITFIMATIIIAILTSCKKGDTGPEGPAGKDGKDGNANVITSQITVSSWTWYSTYGRYESNVTNTSITQDIIDNGAVMAYYVLSGYWVLPTTYYTGAGYAQTLSYSYSLQMIRFRFAYSDRVDHGDPGSQDFKIVIIPGP